MAMEHHRLSRHRRCDTRPIRIFLHQPTLPLFRHRCPHRSPRHPPPSIYGDYLEAHPVTPQRLNHLTPVILRRHRADEGPLPPPDPPMAADEGPLQPLTPLLRVLTYKLQRLPLTIPSIHCYSAPAFT